MTVFTTITTTTTTTTITVLQLSGFCLRQWGEPVPEEMFTHSHISWSLIISYLLPPSITILSVQFTCLTVFFHNVSPSFLWSTSWHATLHFTLHTFLHPITVFFSQHTPIPSQPVCTEIMSFNPSLSVCLSVSLSLPQTFTWNSVL